MSENFDYLNALRVLEFELYEHSRSYVAKLISSSEAGETQATQRNSKSDVLIAANMLRKVFPERDGLWINEVAASTLLLADEKLGTLISKYEEVRQSRAELEEVLLEADSCCPKFLSRRLMLLVSFALDGRVIDWDDWLEELFFISRSLFDLSRSNGSEPNIPEKVETP